MPESRGEQRGAARLRQPVACATTGAPAARPSRRRGLQEAAAGQQGQGHGEQRDLGFIASGAVLMALAVLLVRAARRSY
jgi:hypothetical protein